ncbi:MAG: GNAT family N-acetyltransferase [Ruminococcaceae bacterium]|nr:GNAT family N-acetyltransferase [Oscillospiraceae bacterium]
MELKIKHFDQLSAAELYKLLQVRSAVFVVEQNCAYQDLDGLDQKSCHLWLEENGEIKACLRIFAADDKWAKIGRVITTERGRGLGADILKAGITACKEILDRDKIFIEAQCYATGFYEKAGFVCVGEEFLEDGIPHIKMIKEQ